MDLLGLGFQSSLSEVWRTSNCSPGALGSLVKWVFEVSVDAIVNYGI
jgi:hypothetical protein